MKKVQKFIMRITLPEQIKRRNTRFQKERLRMENISDDELLYQVIDLRARLEYQKNLLSFLLATILIAGVSDVWKLLYAIAKKAWEASILSSTATAEDVMALLTMCFMVAGIFTVAIFAGMIWYLHTMYHTRCMLLIAEEVKETRGR